MLQPSPPNPVVVCWRGPESDPAVRLGIVLAQTLSEPLLLATAYDYEPAALTSAITAAEGNEERQEQAEAALRRVEAAVEPRLEARMQALPAIDVPTALGDLARSVDASVIVLGRDHGDHHVAEAVGRDGPCPVAIAPDDEAPDGVLEIRRIGVAYDDTYSSRNAVRIGRHLAARAEGRVKLICVGGEIGPWPALVEAGGALGVDADPLMLRGDVAVELRAAAAELDLLICGTHGRGRLGAAVRGSVSAQLIADCPCPLIVVPGKTRRRALTPLGVTTAALL